MLIEIGFRDGKRVNVLSIPVRYDIKCFPPMEKRIAGTDLF